MEKPLLRVSNLCIKLNQHLILDGISFVVNKDETLAIIGPNGAGKTALFRAMLGLIPYTGTIDWKAGIKIGYVPQRFYVEPDIPLTTAEFIALKESDQKEIEIALAAVGFEKQILGESHPVSDILNTRLGFLSGGELQRILIAWALVGHPDVLLFDEPTTGIDVSSEQTIYSLLHNLQEKEKLTIILISHEMHIVYRYATNVLCLNKKEVSFGPPRNVLDKQSLAKLFGEDIGLYHQHDH